jgi:hypothetical protein
MTMSKTNFRPLKINFTVEERDTITEYAKMCGLTVSEMARALLKQYQPKPMPDRAFREAVARLYKLHAAVKDNPEASAQVEDIILQFEKAALSPERGNPIGHNQSLGGYGAARSPHQLCREPEENTRERRHEYTGAFRRNRLHDPRRQNRTKGVCRGYQLST